MGLPLRATIGEVRTEKKYVSCDEIINSCQAGYGATAATVTVGILYKVLEKIGYAVAGPTVIATLSGITFGAETMIRLLRVRGCKGFNITYKYKYCFKYGDPTTMPRWEVIDVSYSAVY